MKRMSLNDSDTAKTKSVSKLPMECPECGALMLTVYCPECGYTSSDNTLDSGVTKITADDVQDDSTTPENESLFENIDNALVGNDFSTAPKLPKGKIFGIVALFLVLAASVGFGVWKYTETDLAYADPVTGGLAVIPGSVAGTTDEVAQLSDVEKTIELDLGLKEGNFVNLNYGLFAESSNVFMQMFGISDYLNKFGNDKVLDTLKKDFDVEEDDINVYLNDKFALIFSADTTETFGLVLSPKDESFINDNLKVYEAKVAAEEKSSKLKDVAVVPYSDYYVKVVKIPVEQDLEEKVDVTITEEKVEEGSESTEEKTVETKSTEDEEKSEVKTEDVYILISNSKEFLDRMKELSEGVIPNLSNSAVYAQALDDLPTVGLVSVYKPSESKAWVQFASWFAWHYEYIGFDRILTSIDSPNIVLYNKDSKLKIVGM